MNNFRNNNRKNRFKPNGDRNYRKRTSNIHRIQNDFNTNSDFKHRSPSRNNQNAAKLIDKYNNLAREALSSGDKILSENYLQHADHFLRILSLQEINKTKNEESSFVEQNFKQDINSVSGEKNKNNINTEIK
tara:strand:+ start:637 stop:1032 length:396 start_codon:yes stop_codon:yes gene_type:complete